MMEHDLIWMTLLIFIPTLFALVLCVPRIFPSGSEEWMRWWTLLGTTLTLVVSLIVFIGFYLDVWHGAPAFAQASDMLEERATIDMHNNLTGEARHFNDWVARVSWIPHFNIYYFLGVDGISLPLILLTTVLSFLAVLASWKIEKHVRGYCILFLILETGMIGTFVSLDFFLFYIFWEVMLLPMYFLIGVWGGPRREYAAIKFFLFTLLGSVFILIAMLGFYFTDVRDFVDPQLVKAAAQKLEKQKSIPPEEAMREAEVNSFDIITLQKAGRAASLVLEGKEGQIKTPVVRTLEEQVQKAKELKEKARLEDDLKIMGDQAEINKRFEQPFFSNQNFQYAMFLLLFVGFAIKVPVFPFHTWLPDAHVEAPTPISMILAGVLLKMGGYGILRIAYPICPWAAQQLAFWVALFGVINIVYGAFTAMAQSDFKKLVAYSSISHMGYVILGIAVWSSGERSRFWDWGMNGAMFQMIAHGITSAGMFFLVGVVYDRAHHRNLDNFRGLYEPMPLYGGISAVIFFAAMGLPGMCGFIGEFMVVLSTWNFSPEGFKYSGMVFAILAALTVVLTAAYILWTLQRVFLGQNLAYKDFPEITPRELACITPLVVLSVLLGVMPGLLLSWMQPSVTALVNTLARVW